LNSSNNCDESLDKNLAAQFSLKNFGFN